MSRRKAALVAAMQAQAADSAQLERAEQQFDAYEGRGSEVLDDPAYFAAERAHTVASDAYDKSAHVAVWARIFLQHAQLEQCREECTRLRV